MNADAYTLQMFREWRRLASLLQAAAVCKPSASVRRKGYVALLVMSFMYESGCARHSRPLNVVVIADVTATSNARGMHAGVWYACRKYGFTRYWNAPTHIDDYDRQIELIDRHLHAATAGLVLLPDNPTAPLTEVVDAHRAGVPVVIVHAPLAIDPGPGVYYILNEDDVSASAAVERMFEGRPNDMTVAISGMNDEDVAGLHLQRALLQQLHLVHPKASVVVVSADRSGITAAQDALSSKMANTPQIGGVFALQLDSIYAALAQQPLPSTHKLRIVGFDIDGSLQEQIANGSIDELIVENRYRMGELAVETLAALHHNERPARYTLVPPMLITKHSLTTLVNQPPFNGRDR